MTIAMLKEVDGAVVLPLTPDLLAALSPGAHSSVECDVQDGQLIVHAPSTPLKARRRSKYTLDDLLDQCDPAGPVSEEDSAWDRMLPVGHELL